MSRNRYARGGGLRIAYDLRGTMHRQRPWLVLIQGMGLDRSGWEPVLRKLGRRFRLVLIDNRGTGYSDRLVTFPELGHLLFWEDPDGFADAAASFLLGSDGAGTDG